MSIKLASKIGNRVYGFAVGVAVAAVCATSSVWAAEGPPEVMAYQSVLVDGNGTRIGSSSPQNYDVIFRIYSVQTAGTTLWTEQQTITVDNGYFSVLLGSGVVVGSEPRPALSAVFTNATASDRYIGVTVKGIGAGGADVDIMPRLRLVSSPYAYTANMATKVVQSTITSGNIIDRTIVAADIQSGAITGNEIQDGSIPGQEIANNAIDSTKIADGSILSADIATDTITAGNLAAASVGTSELADGAVATIDIQDYAITANKLASNAISGGVALAALATDSILADKLAPNSVGNSELVDSITLTNLIVGTGTANGTYAVAEGGNTTASGYNSHAEGGNTTASGNYSHAAGQNAKATNNNTYVWSDGTTIGSTADSQYTVYALNGIRLLGGVISGNGSGLTNLGSSTMADSSITSVKISDGTIASSDIATDTITAGNLAANSVGNSELADDITLSNLVVGTGIANGTYAVAEGNSTTSSANYAHAEGYYTRASGVRSHAEGCYTQATNDQSHAEGDYSSSFGNAAHAEGTRTVASGQGSHAEGGYTTASGNYSHAEGYTNTASGVYSHAEGYGTLASGGQSHAEGNVTTASGNFSHAEGNNTVASGSSSHAAGSNAKATNDNTYVWSDGTSIGSTAASQYTVYAGGGIRLLGGFVTCGASDFILGTTDGRPQGTSKFGNRALVHAAANDVLEINFEGDFEGGVKISGNVGMGTDPDSGYRLKVNGNTYCTTSWGTSDERWKRDIQPLIGSLDKVSQLQGVSYFWRQTEFPEMNFDDRRQMGLIAQQVEPIVPDVVYTDDKGYKSLSYEKLTALLIEAVKELKSENQAKDGKIHALQAGTAELLLRLEALEAKVDGLVHP